MPSAFAEKCFKIRGRAVWYRVDGFFAIWHVGTHHIFMPADNKSADLICKYFDCDSGDRQPALFADFTVCPTEPFKAGAAQPARVTKVEHPRVVPEWPPESARSFVEDFYRWYVPRAQSDDSSGGWTHTLSLIRWDLSDELAKLLDKDSAAQARCKELVGLDFDPFLATQDPAEKYRVGEIRRVGNQYRADIYPVDHGQQSAKPGVTAVFVKKSEHWNFVNFLYPGGSDLLTVLKSRPPCEAPR